MYNKIKFKKSLLPKIQISQSEGLNYLQTIKNSSLDLILIDPPKCNSKTNFNICNLEDFIEMYYKKLRKGGTLIVWFDIWKLNILKELMEKHKFKQIRLIEWIKSNTVSSYGKINYLKNCRKVALVGVKVSKPTFNSIQDNGLYMYENKINLYIDIIKKHSNKGDVVCDTFLGVGTTALACKNTNRRFKGCEIKKSKVKKIKSVIKS